MKVNKLEQASWYPGIIAVRISKQENKLVYSAFCEDKEDFIYVVSGKRNQVVKRRAWRETRGLHLSILF